MKKTTKKVKTTSSTKGDDKVAVKTSRKRQPVKVYHLCLTPGSAKLTGIPQVPDAISGVGMFGDTNENPYHHMIDPTRTIKTNVSTLFNLDIFNIIIYLMQFSRNL